MEEPAVGSQWICGECEQLGYFERILLQSLVRIGDELFALVEKKANKE
jgi:type II secretory ATPase GspE/PulE/Tfp pilus assembly ATPase PilB-like protein